MRREREREFEKNSQYRGKKCEFGREGRSINSNLSDAACSCAASTRRFENMTPALCFTQRRNFMIPVSVEGTLQRRYLTPHMGVDVWVKYGSEVDVVEAIGTMSPPRPAPSVPRKKLVACSGRLSRSEIEQPIETTARFITS
jgi:hypothetical protein